MRYDSLVEAVVLKQQPLAEADVLGTWFTRELGKVRGVVASGRRPQSRLSAALLPGAVVRIRLVARHDKGLFTVAGTRDAQVVIRSFSEVQACVYAWVAECIVKAIPDLEPHAALFDGVQLVYKRIAAMQDADAAFVCAGFLVLLLSELGIAPREQIAGAVRWYDPAQGLFVAEGGNARLLPVAAATHERYVVCRASMPETPSPADAALARLLAHVLERYLERPIRSFAYVNDIL